VLLIGRDCPLTHAVARTSESIEGLNLLTVEELAQAGAHFERDDLALALLHLDPASPETDVLELLRTAARRPFPVVVLSDHYENRQAVRLLMAGADDYLGLPLDLTWLAYLLDTLTIRSRAGARLPAPAPENGAKKQSSELLFYVWTPQMVEMMQQVRRVVAQDTTILITGETGTGKSRLARLVHELSPRRDEPFLVVDCGALSPTLIESEMFGHVRGAFTGADRERVGKFAAAGRGTLLLDEINALTPALQCKLLRAVEDRIFEPVGSNKAVPLRARLIAVSNTSLPQEVAAGNFRSDLYYRLNVVGFSLPPLRRRPDMIPHLANRFLAEFSPHELREMHTRAFQALCEYSWPGNIREMRNVIERAVALSANPEIQLRDLPEALTSSYVYHGRDAGRASPHFSLTAEAPAARPRADKEADEIERILAALQKHRNNRLRAAAELGISRMGLYKKLHKYGLMRP
jgi:DNA-binding NtrC family response regulator